MAVLCQAVGFNHISGFCMKKTHVNIRFELYFLAVGGLVMAFTLSDLIGLPAELRNTATARLHPAALNHQP